MKTLEQAAETQGITLENEGLHLHFSPIPNWYGCILGFDCPRCKHPINWEWKGKMPHFTSLESTSKLAPTVIGAKLVSFGHRWIRLICDDCQTSLMAENFDQVRWCKMTNKQPRTTYAPCQNCGIAFVQSQVTCALIELEGMKAANQEREYRGESLAYCERDFLNLLIKYPIQHNDVLAALNNQEAELERAGTNTKAKKGI